MKNLRWIASTLLVAGSLFAFGCSSPKPEPNISSSASQSGYAERYPAALQSAATRFTEHENAAKGKMGEFSGYPNQLKDPNWTHVVEVAEQADQAGRSYDYVERARNVEGASQFFEDNKEEITKKVAGAAQYAAKQKGCEVDVAGPVAHALKESVDDRLEKYLRERSEAHRLIDRYRDSLGKENVAALEKQADDISLTSYLVHIDMVEHKLRVKRMLEEVEAVKKSTDEAIEAERKFQSEPKRTPEEKKASEERIKELNKSKALLESAASQSQDIADTMEERIKAIQKEYREAFWKLDNALREKGGLEQLPPPEEEEE